MENGSRMTDQMAIQIEGLNKTYTIGLRHKIEVLKDVSLSVRKGEIFGFLGPNGAGKTTLIKSMLGLLKYGPGRIRLFNRDINNLEVKSMIGFQPETPTFYPHLTAMEVMQLCAGLFAMSSDGTGGVGGRDARVREKLELAGLTDAADARTKTFSKGMLQRLGLAQALINDPELLILDEPMSGLDPIGRAEFKETMRRLRGWGTTIFFSSHVIPDVEELCDRIAIIKAGRIIQTGAVSEFSDTGVAGVDIIATRNGEQHVMHIDDRESIGAHLTELVKDGFTIVNVEWVKQSLEAVISKLMKD